VTQRSKSREKSKEFLHVINLPQKIHELHVPLRQRYCFTHPALPIKSKTEGNGISGSREVPQWKCLAISQDSRAHVP
jgi:hypothetical protein